MKVWLAVGTAGVPASVPSVKYMPSDFRNASKPLYGRNVPSKIPYAGWVELVARVLADEPSVV